MQKIRELWTDFLRCSQIEFRVRKEINKRRRCWQKKWKKIGEPWKDFVRWSQIEFWVRKVQSIEFPGQERRGTHLARRCQHHAAIKIIFPTHINNFIHTFLNFYYFSLQFQHPSSLISNTGPKGDSSMQYKTENDRISVQKQIIWASWGLCIRVIRFLWYWKPIFFFVLCEIYALRVVHSSWR